MVAYEKCSNCGYYFKFYIINSKIYVHFYVRKKRRNFPASLKAIQFYFVPDSPFLVQFNGENVAINLTDSNVLLT